jgi:hypothetical protein
MTTEDWHQVLARVTGDLVRGEQRVLTQELFTKHLGVPMTDRACRRLSRVMRGLGWNGPRTMRMGKKTLHGYSRAPTADLPAMPAFPAVQDEHAAEIATMGEGTLAPKLEKVTRLGLDKLEEILRFRTDRGDGNLLRAQTAAASTAIHAQLKADETRLRQKTQGDVLDRLLKAIADAKAKMAKQEAARGPVRELSRLDVPRGEDADDEAAN